MVGVFPACFALIFVHAASWCGLAGDGRLIIMLIIIAVQYFCFNLFHLDGLCDTADAFLGAFDKEKRLAILKDSRIGVYGFFAGICALSFKAAFFWTVFPRITENPLFAAWPLFGRFSAALIPCLSPPLRADGLGALAKNSRVYRCVLGLLTALAVYLAVGAGAVAVSARTATVASAKVSAPFWAAPLPLLITAAAQTAAAFFVAVFFARLYRKRLGGYTGDTLGAAIETAELAAMPAAMLATWLPTSLSLI